MSYQPLYCCAGRHGANSSCISASFHCQDDIHPLFLKASQLSLHIFCDASSKAFAAVAYLRVVHADGVDCTLVAAKARVSPLKPMSIPRLELQAAVLGVRLSEMLKKEHDLIWQETVFWSDSRTVLQWIRSDARQYKPFVAHRIGEICEASEPAAWHWVPTSLNVADDATRGLSMDELCKGRWCAGPQFLQLSSCEWPQEAVHSEESRDDQEVKSEFLGVSTTPASQPVLRDILPDPDRFSSYTRLVRATAWVFPFCPQCCSSTPWSTACY